MLYNCERMGNKLKDCFCLEAELHFSAVNISFYMLLHLQSGVQLHSEDAVPSSHTIHKHQESISNFVV